ncbi:hypothetical protein E5843_00255 [Luteimonas yindakuii]|uniref:hypothetical protein n=1 Tax=Luteimonas yindakuii TaxID=2565782 RepID=UPI0010A2D104|nr:hypothetical protein [Luteimonas yindakuii]QCO66621.1 hypothetical protein E5843_00255 [Luteimonas yindakuii]
MSIFRDLLFLHGHITDVELARSLAGADVVSDEPGASAVPAPASASATTGREDDHAIPPCATGACA